MGDNIITGVIKKIDDNTITISTRYGDIILDKDNKYQYNSGDLVVLGKNKDKYEIIEYGKECKCKNKKDIQFKNSGFVPDILLYVPDDDKILSVVNNKVVAVSNVYDFDSDTRAAIQYGEAINIRINLNTIALVTPYRLFYVRFSPNYKIIHTEKYDFGDDSDVYYKRIINGNKVFYFHTGGNYEYFKVIDVIQKTCSKNIILPPSDDYELIGVTSYNNTPRFIFEIKYLGYSVTEDELKKSLIPYKVKTSFYGNYYYNFYLPQQIIDNCYIMFKDYPLAGILYYSNETGAAVFNGHTIDDTREIVTTAFYDFLRLTTTIHSITMCYR